MFELELVFLVFWFWSSVVLGCDYWLSECWEIPQSWYYWSEKEKLKHHILKTKLVLSYAEETAYFDDSGVCCIYASLLISSGCQMNNPRRAWTSWVQHWCGKGDANCSKWFRDQRFNTSSTGPDWAPLFSTWSFSIFWPESLHGDADISLKKLFLPLARGTVTCHLPLMGGRLSD